MSTVKRVEWMEPVYSLTGASIGENAPPPSEYIGERKMVRESRQFFGLSFEREGPEDYIEQESFSHQFPGEYEPMLNYNPGSGSWRLSDDGGYDACGFRDPANERTFLKWLQRKMKGHQEVVREENQGVA